MKPLVTIICPAFNSELYIEDTLKSILSQSFSQWELLIIDDGSKDNTANIVQSYIQRDARIKLISREVNSGVSAARNFGIGYAKSDYIAFMDADDVYLSEDTLSSLVASLQKEKDSLAGVFCKTIICDESFKPLGLELKGQETLTFEHILISPIHINSMLLKREAFQGNSFDCSYSKGEDWLFLSRILRQGSKLKFVDKVSISYRWHPNSVTNRDFLEHEEALKDIIALFVSHDEGCLNPAPEWENGLQGVDFNAIWAKRQFWSLIYSLLNEDWGAALMLAEKLQEEHLRKYYKTSGVEVLTYPAIRKYTISTKLALKRAIEAYEKHWEHWDKALNMIGQNWLSEKLRQAVLLNETDKNATQ